MRTTRAAARTMDRWGRYGAFPFYRGNPLAGSRGAGNGAGVPVERLTARLRSRVHACAA
jgi:hypothetical protein